MSASNRDADVGTTEPGADPAREWVPFPVEALPACLARLVLEGSAAIGCDPSYIALPMLAALAAGIGNTRRILLRDGWAEPAVVWTCIVGESGTLKSPALDLALEPLRERQSDEIAQWKIRKAAHDEQMKAAKRDADIEPPDDLEPPKRILVSDCTVEGLADRLEDSPRGLCLERDELGGWLGGFDRYAKGGKGGDVPHWLSIFGARQLLVDRKTGPKPLIFVERAAVSITGGIQPKTLRRALGRERFDDGLAARLLLAAPPRRAKDWTEATVSPDTLAGYRSMIHRLLELEPLTTSEGKPYPDDLPLDPAAKARYVRFYRTHAIEEAARDGDLAAAWSKLEGYAARLALVVHCATWAAESSEPFPGPVTLEAIETGIAIANWCGAEAERLYAEMGAEGTRDEGAGALARLLLERGSLSVRELMTARRRQYRTAPAAKAALAELVASGAARWDDEAGPGGRQLARVVPAEAV